MLGKRQLLGATESGAQVAAAYADTPSSEITETPLASVVKDSGMYVEWSIKEKVAFEAAVATSICKVRDLACMKPVVVNVAYDSVMVASYMGAKSRSHPEILGKSCSSFKTKAETY